MKLASSRFALGRFRPLACAALLFAASAVLSASQLDGGTFKPIIDETKGQTLFAFDDVSIPFTRSLRIEMHAPEKYSGNPVLGRGKSGEADSWAIHFYGSVIRVDGKFRMWYVGTGDERGQNTHHDTSLWRVLYAESTDGVNWVRPKLGMVDYRGNKQNNIMRLDPFMGTINIKVLHEPEDPDPTRRYKMVTHAHWMKGDARHGTLAPYGSADGLNWKLLVDITPDKHTEMPRDKLLLPDVHFEPAGGLYKWDGFYYATGQNPIPAARHYYSRIARAYRSSDFVEWSQTSNINFLRHMQYVDKYSRGNDGKQTHEGISVWNRGNVLLGMYGQWEGAKSWPGITINQGFVVSNDGLNFREPVQEWLFMKVGPDGTWDEGGLMQGQGFENVGDKTYIYYGSGDLRTWTAYKKPIPPRGSVGLATVPRDRLGDLRVYDTQGEGASEFVTNDVAAKAGATQRLYINADGLGADAKLKIELLTHEERPIPGYSGANAAVITRNGFQTPVSWKGGDLLKGMPARYRIKTTFEGGKKDGIRFYAFYVQPGEAAKK
ncbi:MAG: hypothetical protein V4773_14515 [Verrucomicrobiota bacterium]